MRGTYLTAMWVFLLSLPIAAASILTGESGAVIFYVRAISITTAVISSLIFLLSLSVYRNSVVLFVITLAAVSIGAVYMSWLGNEVMS